MTELQSKINLECEDLRLKNNETSFLKCRTIIDTFTQQVFQPQLTNYRLIDEFNDDVSKLRQQLDLECVGPSRLAISKLFDETEYRYKVTVRLQQLSLWWKGVLFYLFGISFLITCILAILRHFALLAVHLLSSAVGIVALRILNKTVRQMQIKDYVDALKGNQSNVLFRVFGGVASFFFQLICNLCQLVSQLTEPLGVAAIPLVVLIVTISIFWKRKSSARSTPDSPKASATPTPTSVSASPSPKHSNTPKQKKK
eukprot:TRINITY_DN8208_c0_g2_i1.p1 TRINITY_DN8208_c0_g2~~TRINITY_DN8208_c0_g2_i1.p1  ORF type:complete len:294 (+),score=124.91 TRINITY_DN8208_c0_g2_i1:117-884(+)